MRRTTATTAAAIVALAAVGASCSTTTRSASSTSAASPTSSPPAATAVPSTATTTSAAPTTASTPTTASAPTTAAAPTTSTTVADPPPPNDAFADLSIALDLVADVAKPTAIGWQHGDPAMYVATQPGPIYRVGSTTTVTLDLTAETFEDLPGSERGVLGLAFDPITDRMFVNYTDLGDDTQVVSFEVVDGVADPDSRREVLTVEQPGVGHNGGRLVFDAAGHLYIGTGDGGGSNGRDAQDTTKLLGAILRVTPDPDGPGYSVPADNPFVGTETDRPEVIARGLRNPWGFSLDEPTGDIWIGDVGNDEYEEIDVMRAGTWGQNFGWYYFEGTNQRRSQVPDGLSPPVHDYPRSDGVAVMGGYVYRGRALAGLRGAYVFGDLTGPIWAIGADGVTRLDVPSVNTMTGWGEDESGELYVFGLYDGVYRLVPA